MKKVALLAAASFIAAVSSATAGGVQIMPQPSSESIQLVPPVGSDIQFGSRLDAGIDLVPYVQGSTDIDLVPYVQRGGSDIDLVPYVQGSGIQLIPPVHKSGFNEQGSIGVTQGHTVFGAPLKCVVAGTPSEFPDDVSVKNVGSAALPAGTMIGWKLGQVKGAFMLPIVLKSGHTIRIDGVLGGGVEAGRACVAKVISL